MFLLSLPGLEYIVPNHAHDNHRSADQGKGTHILLIKDGHQDRVEHWLNAGDQACSHRGRGFQADGQQSAMDLSRVKDAFV